MARAHSHFSEEAFGNVIGVRRLDVGGFGVMSALRGYTYGPHGREPNVAGPQDVTIARGITTKTIDLVVAAAKADQRAAMSKTLSENSGPTQARQNVAGTGLAS